MTAPRAIEKLIAPYAMAGYPAIALETYEDGRVIAACLEGLHEDPDDRTKRPRRPVYCIAAAGGLRDLRKPSSPAELMPYPAAFEKIAKMREPSLLIVLDWQHMAGNAPAYRPMLQALPGAKANGSIFVFIAPAWNLPAELRHELPVITIPLPSADELSPALDVITEATGAKLADAARQALTRGAQGLTQAEAENAFALAALRLNGTPPFSPSTVEAEKMRLVKSACMNVEAPAPATAFGGYDNLKAYVTDEVIPALDDPQLAPRGIGAAGIPGCGKSLFARVVASLTHRPLIRLDVSAAKGSLMGQSEGNLRHALQTAEAVAPCVLWIDEIEKALGGHASSAQTDGGTTLAMVGMMLTTLQNWADNHVPVFLVVTCNDPAKLPEEFKRSGRFDKWFWFDIPTQAEREVIAAIHLQKLNCNIANALTVAELTEGFTGAEIEGVILSAARRTRRALTPEAIQAAAADCKPLAKRRNIEQLRELAADMSRANSDADAAPTGRKIARRGPKALQATAEGEN